MNKHDGISKVVSKRRDLAMEASFRLFSEPIIEAVGMTDIADEAGMGVASLYRYFGTKLQLAIELCSLKWQRYGKQILDRHAQWDAQPHTALEEFGFYLECYIDLFMNYPEFLRFHSNFIHYVRHEHATRGELEEYYGVMQGLNRRFAEAYQARQNDGSICSELPAEELFCFGMHSMLTVAQQYVSGIVFSGEWNVDFLKGLKLQKQILMAYATTK